MLRSTIIFLFIIVCVKDVACKKLRQETPSTQSEENASGKRTLMIGKLVLLPVLAGVGIKFLLLLPVILSKIALLGILSFVSSNLSLLVSAVMGVRSYFFEDKPIEEDYDYDYRYKNYYDHHGENEHLNYDGHRYHENDYDPYETDMHRYKSYEPLNSAYHSHYPDYKDHRYYKPLKKRFRPFLLLGRIKDVIKDHFHQSGDYGKKYHGYHHDYKHHASYDDHDDHDRYGHRTAVSKYRTHDRPMINQYLGARGKYYEGYVVPQDRSQKQDIFINDEGKKDTSKETVIVSPSELIKNRLSVPELQDNAEKLGNVNFNDTRSITGYKVYESEPKFKEPFVVLGLRPQTGESDSPSAFYTADYKIKDFKNVQQADTSK